MSHDAAPITAESARSLQWDVADRMRKALRHTDLGVQEIADYLGVSRTTAGNWINGHISPSTQTLRLWALRCGVTYEWLVSGDSEPQP
jgi:transcriptional regulator with XRE-family HTH domain